MELNEIEGTCAVLVKKLLPVIESYRTEGYKLTRIYAAMPDDIKGKMVVGTFRNVYYKVRSKVAIPTRGEGKKQVKNPVSDTSLELSLSSLAAAAQLSVSPSKKPKRVIDFSQSIEEHQAIARAEFNRQ